MAENRDWYLREWAAARGKRQADLTRDLGWPKNTVHLIWHSKQPYSRDRVNELAGWLGVEPFELLMSPDEARELRLLRETAQAIASRLASAPVGSQE